MIGLGAVAMAAFIMGQQALPPIQRQGLTMGRFRDNDSMTQTDRQFLEARTIEARYQVERRRRLILRLDRMIADGHCDGARAVARRAPDHDIRDAVAQACPSDTGA